MHLGLRLGEVCGLSENDINFRKKVLKVNKTLQYVRGEIIIKDPKTETSKREIPLTHNMISFFKKRIKEIKENQLYMGDKYNKSYLGFLSVFEDGTIMNDSYVTKRFNKA